MGSGASVFQAALEQRHAEEMQRMTQEAAAHHAVLTSYLGGGPVAQQEALAAMRGLGKGFPKEHQKEWNKHVDALELSLQPQNKPAPPGDGAKPQTLSPAGVQPNAPGLPAPPSASDSLGAETGGTPPPFASSAPASLPQPPAQAPPAPSTPPAAPAAPAAPAPQAQPQPPAAAPQLPVVPPSPVSEGFSTSGLTPPPVAPPAPAAPAPYTEPGGLLSPVDMARRKAEKDRIGAQAGIGIDRQKFEARKAMMGPKPASMTDRQWTEVLMGQNPTPEPHFAIPGSTLSTYGDMDRQGNAVPEGTPGRRMYVNGQTLFVPETGTFQSHMVPQADGTVKAVQTDRFGHVIGPDGKPTQEMFTGAQGVAPGMQPHTTSRTGEQIITTTDADGNIVQKAVPVSSRTTRTVGAGGATSPATTGLPAPPTGAKTPAPVKPAGAGNGGGRVIGQSPQQTTRQWENELTPNGQKAVAESEPVLDQVNRAMAMLESTKNENTPLAEALPRLGYSVGIATDVSKLINNLELGKVIGASRVLKGGSRALPALELAMKHLPIVEKDSAKLMYEKLQNVKQNLEDIKAAAFQYERKYPGMPRGGKNGGGITPPPSADVPRSYKSTATGPGGHKIGSDDEQNWFDVQTGKPI